ncbi:type 1 fimbrial protein [Escherichia coli]|nr:type 1 fimbrial protein [Escherichia coli]
MVVIDAGTFPKTLGSITSSAVTSTTTVSGKPNSTDKDRVKITATTFNTVLSSRDFIMELNINGTGWVNYTAVVNTCVWYDDSCGIHYTSWPAKDIVIQMRLRRTSTATYLPIASNTIAGSVTLKQEGSSKASKTISFIFNGPVAPALTTCSVVDDYDKKILLPAVKRTTLMNLTPPARYSGITKEFELNLNCDLQTNVSVIFDGTKMTGIATDDVLANLFSGNDNVGIQLYYKNNPVKIGTKFTVTASSQAAETLKFNTYYFYKGGAVSGGGVKAQTEFTFSYP